MFYSGSPFWLKKSFLLVAFVIPAPDYEIRGQDYPPMAAPKARCFAPRRATRAPAGLPARLGEAGRQADIQQNIGKTGFPFPAYYLLGQASPTVGSLSTGMTDKG
jgi:hypothetical protein